MKRRWGGGVVVIVSQLREVQSQSPVQSGPSLPAEPTSTRSQTREGGLNQTYEPQNMTWQVQQEKRGGGES